MPARPATFLVLCFLAVLFVVLAAVVKGEDSGPELRFENHRFAPQTLTVPAGHPLVLRVLNASQETIEFESFQLHREKVIEPEQTITVHLPPLSPGTYDFYDDFHQDVPEGSLIAQ